jgi:hypothetical protein
VEANTESDSARDRFYYRWWIALPVAPVGVVIVSLGGPRANPPVILDQLHEVPWKGPTIGAMSQ